jgi:hypothetical protein
MLRAVRLTRLGRPVALQKLCARVLNLEARHARRPICGQPAARRFTEVLVRSSRDALSLTPESIPLAREGRDLGSRSVLLSY